MGDYLWTFNPLNWMLEVTSFVPDISSPLLPARHPVSLEQYIMEGSYNKVVLAKGNVPAESYKYFIDILMGTVRNEIASCLEKAYGDISCSDAARMLSINSGE